MIFAGWFGIRLLPVVTRGAREAAEALADQADAAGTARREGHRTGRDHPDNERLLWYQRILSVSRRKAARSEWRCGCGT